MIPLWSIDIEADGLRKQASKIHCAVAMNYQTKEVLTFANVSENPHEFEAFLQEVYDKGEGLAGHHLLGYDYPVMCRLLRCPPFLLDVSRLRLVDTLVLSKMLNYKRESGHSLESWGVTFGIKKVGADIKDWSTYTPLMLERCISDVTITDRLLQKFERFLKDDSWVPSISVEHEIADVCLRMEQTGVPFDVQKAQALRHDLQEMLKPIDAAIERDFPPSLVVIRHVTPRMTQAGTWNLQDFRWASTREWTYDAEKKTVILGERRHSDRPDLSCFDLGDGNSLDFDLCEYEPFNPGSPKQVVQRLNEAGWRPTERTDGHQKALKDKGAPKERLDAYREFGWKISEENLKTLPESAPEGARSIAKRIILQSRLSDLDEWLALVEEDGRLHPEFNSIGAWTQRLSHSKPNSANIPASKPSESDTAFQKEINEINARMRGLFIAPKGKRLVGTDADGIQMRIFADVIEDQKLIDALVKGTKENATDIHSVHQRALGSTAGSRDEAKTFIYAFLLGAGVTKVSEIFGCTVAAAKLAVGNFLDFYPGLKKLKRTLIPQWAARGFFEGLDGRKVMCDSEHLMLSGVLQNGEKVIMARALLQWTKELTARGIPYELVNWVHDEWQTLIDDDDDTCAIVQEVQIRAIRDQAEQLQMLCPLDGSSSWGYSWQETH